MGTTYEKARPETLALLAEVDRLRALERAVEDGQSDRADANISVEASEVRRLFACAMDRACGLREDHYARGFRAGQEDARALAANEICCTACGGTGRRKAGP